MQDVGDNISKVSLILIKDNWPCKLKPLRSSSNKLCLFLQVLWKNSTRYIISLLYSSSAQLNFFGWDALLPKTNSDPPKAGIPGIQEISEHFLKIHKDWDTKEIHYFCFLSVYLCVCNFWNLTSSNLKGQKGPERSNGSWSIAT